MMSFARAAKRSALKLVRSSVALTCLCFAADGVVAGFKGRTSNEDEHLGGHDPQADYDYAQKVADMYSGAGGRPGRVAEIGPGGSAAVALHLLRKGAVSVDLLDRFPFMHDAERLDRVYRLFGNYADLERVRFYEGEEAAAESFFHENRGYDDIYSCAVLEHLSEPLGALGTMVTALEEGGRLVHQVDLRDHGMFTGAGKHELTFLTIPRRVYRLMSEARGRPNRVLIDDYRRVLGRLPVKFDIFVTHLVKVGELSKPMKIEEIDPPLLDIARREVEQIRPRLTPEFRNRTTDDLAVASIRIQAVKERSNPRPEVQPA